MKSDTKRSLAFPGRVLFDHLPKTAGSTITSWLTTELGTGCVSPQLGGQHRDLIRQYGGQYSIISAHVDFYAGERLDPRYSYITCFREPVDRALSWVYYAKSVFHPTKQPRLHQMVTAFIESDGQELDDELILNISNFYVRHFSKIVVEGVQSKPYLSIEHCMDVLSQFDVIGFQENIPAFVSDVSQFLGIENAAQIQAHRVNSTRPSVSKAGEGIKNRLIELNQLDVRLYEEIKMWWASSGQQRTSRTVCEVTPRWDRYDREGMDRVLTTPELIIARASLKEGFEIVQGQVMSFEVDFFLEREIRELITGILIYDSEKRLVYGINSKLLLHSYENLPRGSHRAVYYLIADLPAGNYTAGFNFSEELPGRNRELAWHDVLCAFQVLQQVDQVIAGYCYLSAEMTLIPSSLAKEDKVVTTPTGHLMIINPIASILADERVSMLVEIANYGNQAWGGDIFRPVNLSYYWQDVEGDVISGVRTILPEGGIPSGGTLRTQMLVVAPALPGEYTMVATLVQEHVGWFESMGDLFRPAIIRIFVRTNGDKCEQLHGSNDTGTSDTETAAVRPVVGVAANSARALGGPVLGKNKRKKTRQKQ